MHDRFDNDIGSPAKLVEIGKVTTDCGELDEQYSGDREITQRHDNPNEIPALSDLKVDDERSHHYDQYHSIAVREHHNRTGWNRRNFDGSRMCMANWKCKGCWHKPKLYKIAA